MINPIPDFMLKNISRNRTAECKKRKMTVAFEYNYGGAEWIMDFMQ